MSKDIKNENNACGTDLEQRHVMCLPLMDDELRWILGRPNFTLMNEVKVLRMMGQDIPEKAEDEQAAVLYWILNLYLKHGKNWRVEGQKILKAEAANDRLCYGRRYLWRH